MNRIIVALLLLVLVSCGAQRNLSKAYIGKSQSFVEEQFGKPKTILDKGDEKVYVYEKFEQLRSTEIKQGKLTLDPMVTPGVKKTKRYFFTLSEGKVMDVKLEEEYER